MITPVFEPSQAYYVPRPDRLYCQFRFRRRPAAVEVHAVQAILAEYGLQAQGEVTVPPSPGRSQNVIVETAAGKKMLKRYKQTLDPAAVLHEHSILNYLNRVEFPAPRLTPTVNGQTLIRKDNRCYALFDYLEGYFQYHHYFLLPAQTRQVIAASGRVLGSLHNVLKDFTPEGFHPNGFKSKQGERWRELSWFTDKLATCWQECRHLQTNEAHTLRSMLSRHAGWLEETLYSLNEMLAAAAPTRLIIHGDYGPYNLFLKRGAPVVVLDFELARLDWRLTDLATALPSFARSRLGFNFGKMKCFLEAYQTWCPIDSDELRLLPAVWQFLTLRRVIVFWHRYCTTGAPHWLNEAQHKIDLARWLVNNRERLSGWLTG